MIFQVVEKHDSNNLCERVYIFTGVPLTRSNSRHIITHVARAVSYSVTCCPNKLFSDPTIKCTMTLREHSSLVLHHPARLFTPVHELFLEPKILRVPRNEKAILIFCNFMYGKIICQHFGGLTKTHC